MPDIVLYVQAAFQVPGYEPRSSGTPFAIKIERLLRYKRLPFQIEEIGWLEWPEQVPRLSVSGKLPVLEYDVERLEDSTAMAYFLEERHPEPRLVPEDPLERARMHFMEEWADEVLYFYGIYGALRMGGSTTIPHLSRPLSDEHRETIDATLHTYLEQVLWCQGLGRYAPEKIEVDLARSLDGLETLFARQGFAVGGELSLADLALFGQVSRYFLSGTQPRYEQAICSRPALFDWFRRVDAMTRPSAEKGALAFVPAPIPGSGALASA